MATTENALTQDLLGLKRFALTESAYDLITSLVGIYSRSIFRESEQKDPDAVQMTLWQDRVDELQDLRGNGRWADFFFLEQLIAELTTEYKQAASQEEERANYATKTQSRAVHS